jgi:beta-lactamase regulating signal transducer with metallopeptidase domain
MLRATVIMTVCFLFYKLFLQKATFYRLNRWTLLSCLVLSFALPLPAIPARWNWTSLIASPRHMLTATNALQGGSSVEQSSALAGDTRFAADKDPELIAAAAMIARAHEQQLEKAAMIRNAIARQNSPATQNGAARQTAASTTAMQNGAARQTAAKTTVTQNTSRNAANQNPAAAKNSAAFPLSLLLQLLGYAYLAGLFLFGLKFLLETARLCYRSFAHPAIREGRCRIVETSGNHGPCSFGNTIFINPSLYDAETCEQILIHEKIHVSGAHTLDLFLAELALVIQWFNPFAWLYRREVENNLEFLTDRSVLCRPEIERTAYQLSLLRVSLPHVAFNLTNNYSQSLLKRRIVMMNSKDSNRRTMWRYVALLPLLTGLVCAINRPAAMAQSVSPGKVESPTAYSAPSAAAIGDSAIRPASARPTAAPIIGNGASASPKVGSGASATPAPKPMVIDEGETAPVAPTATPTGAAAAITDILPSTDDLAPAAGPNVAGTPGSGIDLRQGSWFLTLEGDTLEFMLKAKNEEDSWQSTLRVKKSEIIPFPGTGPVAFKLVRDAGTMDFKGQFDGEQGYGHFQLTIDAAYFTALQKMGVSDMDSSREHVFFMLNISKEFVGMLQRNGYTPIDQRDIIMLAARKVDEPFLKYWKSSGVEEAGEARNLIMLKTFHVDADFVNGLRKAGYDHLTARELVSLKARHIDSAFLALLRKVGYDHLDRSEIRSLFAAHVTADFIQKFQDAGFKEIPVRTLVWLRYKNVSPDAMKSFRNLGYTDADLNQLAAMIDAGITPEFVAAFRKIGYDNIPLHELYTLKTTGVDADYVAKMKEKGFNSTDLNKYIRLKRDFN